MRSYFFAIVGIAALSLPASASAVEVNFTAAPITLEMGNVAAGQYGTISYENPSELTTDISGFLPSHTRITFSYTFVSPIGEDASNNINASYDYMSGSNHYQGSAWSYKFTPPNLAFSDEGAEGFVNGFASAPLVFATSNIAGDKTTYKWSVTNESGSFASFANLLLLGSSDGISLLTYSVTQAPLPAALPMFGTLLVGVYGIARFRRKRVAA